MIIKLIDRIDFFFFFKQKTAYEMRISDWSSDVCSSDLDIVDHPDHEETAEYQHEPLPYRARHQQVDGNRHPDEPGPDRGQQREESHGHAAEQGDRKSVVSGKRVSVRVDLGGSRINTQQIIDRC